MSTILTIPKPCSENWNKMTPTQKGAYCKSCQKEVIDFTKTPKIVLSQKLSKGNNLCGRFKSNQLNIKLPSVTRSTFQRNVALLGYTSLLAIGTPLMAQETLSKPSYQVQEDIVMGLIAPTPTDSIMIKGNIGDRQYPLPGASVHIKDTKTTTQTDFDGNFTMSIEKDSTPNEITLIISCLGYQTIEKVVPLETDFVEITCTELEEYILGELVIVLKRNIFRRFLNLFRKK